MKRVLLIDLFALPEYDISLALGYLKAYSQAVPEVREAWDIDLLHLKVETPAQEVADAIARSGADLVGLSCYSWNIRAVERAVALLPPRTERPCVVLGGIEVTPGPVGYLKKNPNADFIVFGEGEQTFRDVLLRMKDRVDPASLGGIPGVAWRDGKTIRQNPPRPPIEDLDTIPSPYLAGAYGDLLKDQDRVMVETARGCPYSCTFCFEPRGFARMRSFSVERAKKELECIAAAGVREVAFLDTNFNMDRKRAVLLWDFLAGLPRRVRYAFELRGELIDEEQARSLSALDYFVEIGLQSVNKKSLDAVKRWYEPRKFANGLRALLEAGIYRPTAASAHGGVGVDLMMGLPNETVADFRRSFDFLFALAPSTVILTVTKILPGTELYDDASKFRYEFDPGAQYEMTSSTTIKKNEVAGLLRFRDAVDFAYNRLHAVRTIGWMAAGLRIEPSDVFADLGDRMAAAGKPHPELTVDELGSMLADICRARGDAALAEALSGRLAAENMLNVLQRNREAKRSWWTNFTFRVGYRFLSRFGGLPPMPSPSAIPLPAEESGVTPPAAATVS